MRHYRDRLSGPLRDRIDLTVQVDPVPFESLATAVGGESSAVVRARVEQARERQRARDRDGTGQTNADLTGEALKQHCALDGAGLALIKRAMNRLGLTGRGFDRVRRVARTIADLDGVNTIRRPHVAEALHYRGID